MSTQENRKLKPTPLRDTGRVCEWVQKGLYIASIWWIWFYTQTHAISRLPPVLETQPRVVGVACLSNPRIPHNKPRKLKARISTTIQHRVIQQIHLKTKTLWTTSRAHGRLFAEKVFVLWSWVLWSTCRNPSDRPEGRCPRSVSVCETSFWWSWSGCCEPGRAWWKWWCLIQRRPEEPSPLQKSHNSIWKCFSVDLLTIFSYSMLFTENVALLYVGVQGKKAL